MAQNPIVTIEMEDGGVMKAELYPEVAPNSVNNFISLVRKGFYNGLIFPRCIPGFMIQGGCPQGTGMGGPGRQFFIMVEKAPHLDGSYAAFGKVFDGMEVADAIVNSKTDWNDRPRQDQRMKSVTVDTFGVEYPEPEKV